MKHIVNQNMTHTRPIFEAIFVATIFRTYIEYQKLLMYIEYQKLRVRMQYCLYRVLPGLIQYKYVVIPGTESYTRDWATISQREL